MIIKRTFVITLLMLGILFITTGTGFVLWEIAGAYIGLGIGVAFILFVLVFGDKLILMNLKAIPAAASDPEVDVLKNISCRLGIKRVSVFFSEGVNNIYAVQGIKKEGKIIIGKNVFETCNAKEIQTLLFSSVVRIKSGEIRYVQNIALVAMAFTFPRYLINRFFKVSQFRLLEVLLMIYELPILKLSKTLMRKSSKVFNHDDYVISLTCEKEAYASAIFKMMNTINNKSLHNPVVDELAVVPHDEKNLSVANLLSCGRLSLRYERLL